MECDGLGLDLSLLHIHLVPGQDDGDVLADTDEVALGTLAEPKLDMCFHSRCQLGTFLYVIRDVTSNMMTPHCPLM